MGQEIAVNQEWCKEDTNNRQAHDMYMKQTTNNKFNNVTPGIYDVKVAFLFIQFNMEAVI